MRSFPAIGCFVPKGAEGSLCKPARDSQSSHTSVMTDESFYKNLQGCKDTTCYLNVLVQPLDWLFGWKKMGPANARFISFCRYRLFLIWKYRSHEHTSCKHDLKTQNTELVNMEYG